MNKNETNYRLNSSALRLALRGTENRTGNELIEEIENIGAVYDAYTRREISSHTLKVMKDDVSKAVELLGDIVFAELPEKGTSVTIAWWLSRVGTSMFTLATTGGFGLMLYRFLLGDEDEDENDEYQT